MEFVDFLASTFRLEKLPSGKNSVPIESSLEQLLEGTDITVHPVSDLVFSEEEGIRHTEARALFVSHRPAMDQAFRAFEGKSNLEGFKKCDLG